MITIETEEPERTITMTITGTLDDFKEIFADMSKGGGVTGRKLYQELGKIEGVGRDDD